MVIGDTEKIIAGRIEAQHGTPPGNRFDAYGVDAARFFVLSDSPPERDVQWTTGGIKGAWRLVNRLWDEFDSQPANVAASTAGGDDPQAVALTRATHRLIKFLTNRD